MPHYRIAPRKVSPGRQFTGKNPFRPVVARPGPIFARKMSDGRDFSGGRSYNGATFYGAGEIFYKKEIYQLRTFHGGNILMWHRHQQRRHQCEERSIIRDDDIRKPINSSRDCLYDARRLSLTHHICERYYRSYVQINLLSRHMSELPNQPDKMTPNIQLDPAIHKPLKRTFVRRVYSDWYNIPHDTRL